MPKRPHFREKRSRKKCKKMPDLSLPVCKRGNFCKPYSSQSWVVTNVTNLGRTSRLIGLRKCFKFPTCLLLVLVLVLGDDELRRWLAEDVHIFPELVQLFLKAFTDGALMTPITPWKLASFIYDTNVEEILSHWCATSLLKQFHGVTFESSQNISKVKKITVVDTFFTSILKV